MSYIDNELLAHYSYIPPVHEVSKDILYVVVNDKGSDYVKNGDVLKLEIDDKTPAPIFSRGNGDTVCCLWCRVKPFIRKPV